MRAKNAGAQNHVEWAETHDAEEWDDFVEQSGASIYHTWSWRRTLEKRGLGAYYLACYDAKGQIVAICPFFYEAGRRGRYIQEGYLNSLPDLEFPTKSGEFGGVIRGMAGPIINGDATNAPQIIASLPRSVRFSPLNPVVKMHVKAHDQLTVRAMVALGFRYEAPFGLFIVDLHEKTPEHIWNNGFHKHDRQAIKYHQRLGTEFRLARSESDYLDYLGLQDEQGADQSSYADFFSKMRSCLGERLKVGLVTRDDKAVAGVSILCDSGAGSTAHLAMMRYSAVRNLHSPVTYINWEVINWASRNNFRYVDFGSYFGETSSDPSYPSYKLKRRFEITFVPRYEFTLYPSGASYSIARGVSRILQSVNGRLGRALVQPASKMKEALMRPLGQPLQARQASPRGPGDIGRSVVCASDGESRNGHLAGAIHS